MILPGKWFNRVFSEVFNIEGARVTTAPKGFINSTLFLNLIEFFAKYVPDSVTYPLVLDYAVCCSHYNDYIIKKSVDLKVILVP